MAKNRAIWAGEGEGEGCIPRVEGGSPPPGVVTKPAVRDMERRRHGREWDTRKRLKRI